MSPKTTKQMKCADCCKVVKRWCMSRGEPFCERCYAVMMIEYSLNRELLRINQKFPELSLQYVIEGMGNIRDHIFI